MIVMSIPRFFRDKEHIKTINGWHGKNVDQGESYWVLVDAFAGSVQLPNCLCCNWALQLPVICSLLLAANEQPGGKAPRRLSKVP